MSAFELLPYDRLKELTFTPEARQSADFSRSGRGQIVEFGRSYWMLRAEWRGLDIGGFRALSAFVMRRSGSAVPFTAYRPKFEAPLNMPDLASNAGVNLYNVSTAASTCEIGGIPEPMAVGDMVGWETDGGFYLGQVTELLDHVGSTSTIRLSPAAATPASSDNVRIYRALGAFRMVRGSWSHSEPYDGVFNASLTGYQEGP